MLSAICCLLQNLLHRRVRSTFGRELSVVSKKDLAILSDDQKRRNLIDVLATRPGSTGIEVGRPGHFFLLGRFDRPLLFFFRVIGIHCTHTNNPQTAGSEASFQRNNGRNGRPACGSEPMPSLNKDDIFSSQRRKRYRGAVDPGAWVARGKIGDNACFRLLRRSGLFLTAGDPKPKPQSRGDQKYACEERAFHDGHSSAQIEIRTPRNQRAFMITSSSEVWR